MLSQAGAGGETLVTSFTLVRLVPSVDALVVHKIPLRSKSFLASLTFKRSFARVFPHVHFQVKILDKALTAILT